MHLPIFYMVSLQLGMLLRMYRGRWPEGTSIFYTLLETLTMKDRNRRKLLAALYCKCHDGL